ncbi:MAG: diphosphomevalonate decarboxylase [DPANN group archaeon]|nr:diphosphomevalonate decarboxylase [DPANN group archaeon]
MKSTALANANIALVKYWGKRDEKLILPQNSNVSVTLSELSTITTVEFSDDYDEDIFILDDKVTSGKDKERVLSQLDMVREIAKSSQKAKVVSKNNFPTAAGLASSASGSAALVMAATDAIGLNLDKKDLSILARRGSGSSCRSIYGGFVEWNKGEAGDGTDSYAKKIESYDYWPELRVVVGVVTLSEKEVKSRSGMKQTVETCPFYDGWLKSVDKDILDVKEAFKNKDFSLLGKTSEHNALKMHALMIATVPSIIYWNPSTIRIMNAVKLWRENGLESYFTIDAGPQVKLLCLEKDEQEIISRLKAVDGVIDVISCKLGRDAKIIYEHLF